MPPDLPHLLPPPRATPLRDQLPANQVALLDLLVRGATPRETQAALFLGADGVKGRATVLRRITGRTTRWGAVGWAYAEGLYVPDLEDWAPRLPLRPRELEVMEAAVEGLTTVQSARRLHASEDTVATHLQRITRAWGQPHGGQVRLVALACRAGLVRPVPSGTPQPEESAT